MIQLDQASPYEKAIYGETFAVAVRQRLLNTDDPLWRVGEWDLIIPTPKPHRAPEAQRMVGELKAWTSWSLRQLADVLATSHTTVRHIEAGRPLVVAHSGDLHRRILAVHGVVARIYNAANRDLTSVVDALEHETRGSSAKLSLQAGDDTTALLLALNRLRPRPDGLLTGTVSSRDGATAALHD